MRLTSRRKLRRDVLRGLGDLRVLTATSTGTDVDFRDSVNLTGEPGIYRGREVIFVQGTSANVGEIRYVTGSSQTLNAIGFGDALPAATATGDVAEMVNTRGTGFHIQEIHDAINQAIRNIGDRALVPMPVEHLSYTAGDELAIPDEFLTIEDVQWLDENDEDVWHSIRRSPRVTAGGWSVNKGSRTISLAGSAPSLVDGRTVRVWGLAEPEELFADGDETTIDPEYLTMQARANLALERFMRNPTPETERISFLFEQRAGILRAKAVTRRSPFSVEV